MNNPLNKIIGNRIKQFRETLGLTQPGLAKLCGWGRGNRICNYELGNRKLKLEDLSIISDALEIPLACLLSEEEPQKVLTQIYQNHSIKNVPLIDWQLAMKGENAVDELDLNTCSLLAVQKCSNKSFGLRVKGDAMFIPSPEVKSLLQGEIIIADPTAKPEHGKNVIAALPNATEAICRRYIVEGGIPYLKPLNPSWERTTVTPDTKICGVVVAKVDYDL